jgi:predicted membrane chloride channel (bestrophin family)
VPPLAVTNLIAMGKGGLVAYNSSDFFGLVCKIRGSIFDNVLSKLIITNFLCIIAATMNWTLDMFATKTATTEDTSINSMAFTLAGSSISFLLVFRSQISYNRFWEGRGHLGNIMLAGRDLARQISTHVQGDEGVVGVAGAKQQIRSMHAINGNDVSKGSYCQDSGLRAEFEKMTGFRRLQMIRIILIFWRLLVQHARDKVEPEYAEQLWLLKSDEQDVAKRRHLATPHQEVLLKSKKRKPLVALAILTHYIRHEYRSKNITHMEYQAMNQSIHTLIQGFNGVDKVHNVQIPFPYAQMILLFLTTYVFTAPFMFVTHFGWACFIPSSVLCVVFFGINEVALEIEDPFGEDENDLPLDPMGDALKGDCEMSLELNSVPLENMQLYWDEINKSKQRWAKVEEQRHHEKVKLAAQGKVAVQFAQQVVGEPEVEPQLEVLRHASPVPAESVAVAVDEERMVSGPSLEKKDERDD